MPLGPCGEDVMRLRCEQVQYILYSILLTLKAP